MEKIRSVLPDNIPGELRDTAQWVAWRAKTKADGKVDKIPVNPKTGQNASTADPSTWASYDEALSYYQRANSNGMAGVGFVFTERDPFCGIDLDDCIKDGKVEPWAKKILEDLDSYSEISPSGNGIKVFVMGKLPGGAIKTKHIEMYEQGRFFTVTGHQNKAFSGLGENQGAIDRLYHRLRPPKPKSPPVDKPSLSLDDKKVLDLAIGSKSGEKILKLLNGDWSEHPSQSEADQALCNHLAFYCGTNSEQIDRLFRQSGLIRDKWDKKHYGDGRTYGQATIQKAIEITTETYSGGRRKFAKKATHSETLLDIASAADLFHTPQADVYARLEIDGHYEVWNVRAAGFKRYLSNQFFRRRGKSPGAQALNDALTTIEGIGQFECPEVDVHVRFAERNGRIYVDLANTDWEVVEISDAGWRVVNTAPILFKRARGMLPLPHPATHGDLMKLRDCFNVPNEDTWLMTVAWMVQACRPRGPYPVLAIAGEQGAAKSSFSRLLKMVVDPSTAPLRTTPRSERDLAIAAKNGWVLVFDNISGIKDWFSDALCRVSTGGGFATRELWTNDEEALFDYMRPVILNGIDEIITRHDLVDRTIFNILPPIPDHKRLPEKELEKKFGESLPGILAGLFTALSTGLKNISHTHLDQLPRMADFALWVSACEPGLPWEAGSFLSAYSKNRQHVVQGALDSDIVAASLQDWFSNRNNASWEGTASDLLFQLETEVDERVLGMKTWPKDAIRLSSRLRRAANFLRKVGISIAFDRGRKRRTIIVSKGDDEGDINVTQRDDKAILTSPPRAFNDVGGDDGDDGDDKLKPFSSAYFPFVNTEKEVSESSKRAKKGLDRKLEQNNVTNVINVTESERQGRKRVTI